MDVDHIIPHSKGGKTIVSNGRVSCSECNRSKGAN
jgi:5-methylcytosine-specific restriction endonuclease McrA